VEENEFKFKKLVVGSAITTQLNLKTKPRTGIDEVPIVINQCMPVGALPIAYPIRMFATEEDVCGILTGDVGNCIVIWSTGTVKCVARRNHTDVTIQPRYIWTAQLDRESVVKLENYLHQVERIMTECLQELTSTETITYSV
jgi:hypothetical protein